MLGSEPPACETEISTVPSLPTLRHVSIRVRVCIVLTSSLQVPPTNSGTKGGFNPVCSHRKLTKLFLLPLVKRYLLILQPHRHYIQHRGTTSGEDSLRCYKRKPHNPGNAPTSPRHTSRVEAIRKASYLLLCSFLPSSGRLRAVLTGKGLFEGHHTERRRPKHSIVHPSSAFSHSVFTSQSVHYHIQDFLFRTGPKPSSKILPGASTHK